MWVRRGNRMGHLVTERSRLVGDPPILNGQGGLRRERLSQAVDNGQGIACLNRTICRMPSPDIINQESILWGNLPPSTMFTLLYRYIVYSVGPSVSDDIGPSQAPDHNRWPTSSQLDDHWSKVVKAPCLTNSGQVT
ncbi:hypothetical protein RRG08_029786 [Elysia crispata]|uniref:Uncharacterized protein n=1 Tax=Elysia crispata TaxID=231223 RepID=A0AAE1D1V1_9GAST|nr:hypothetical protein RRG08_029786 [Elysia crispata]